MQIGSISQRRGRSAALIAAIATVALVGVTPADAVYQGQRPLPLPDDKDTQGIFVVDGEFVHNVGELQCNITNWGLIGSWPSTNARWADAPSAMWPAGSGVDYLWAAGVWVGAVKNGVPVVTTGQFEYEFLPNPDDPLSTIWSTQQGAAGGARYPDPSYNDDGDVDPRTQQERVNEDPLNGVDDDGDGLIDEDFAAIGNQHFRCEMTDNTSLANEYWPDHEPLNLQLVQESFQWENESVDDFIGFQFTLKNIGPIDIKDIFLGWFADSDVGPRGGTAIAEDDLPWFFSDAVRANDGSLVPVSVACMYDADGDEGQSPGFFGIMFLGHPTDVTGERYPEQVRIRSFQAFGGSQPFDRGGNPTNDAERYDLLSRAEIDQVPPLNEEGKANDFRIMLANGPFASLAPNETLTFQAAMVVGPGPDGLVRNAAEAALTYYGAWFDRDADPDTGVKGRESKICMSDFGPPGPTNPIFSLWQDCVDSLDLQGDNPPAPIQPNELDEDGCIWIDADCPFEYLRGAEKRCQLGIGGVSDPSELAGCTGVQGKEYNVPWLVGLAPDPPNMRLWQTDNRVTIFWNNLSQLIPDVRLQKIDFESYRIWRADGWDRPFGSSIDNGPESRLWRLIAEFDVVDFFESTRSVPGAGDLVQELPLGANTGLDVISYTPAMFREGSPESIEYAPMIELVNQIVEEQGITPGQLVSRQIRYRDEDGSVSELGEQYPELEQYENSYAYVDSASFVAVGGEFYTYEDRDVSNGIAYFYSVTATDFNGEPQGDLLVPIGPGLVGDPQSNFQFASPRAEAQTTQQRSQLGQNIYVVPNPATRQALAEFSQLNPNSDDPTGARIMFANLPRAHNTIKIYTLAGDLVQTIEHDGYKDAPDEVDDEENVAFWNGKGAAFWNLISRNGQEVVSGIYLYSVESDDQDFQRVVGRFVIVR